MNTVHFNKTVLAAAISTTLMLQGCSNNSGDTGTNIQPSGAVVDDYIAYSRIYVDADNDYEFDHATEPYAYTDGNGKFGGDYCRDPYKPEEYKFCLNIPENLKGYPIRVEGGRDILTGMEYEGTMSMKLDGETQDLAITSFSTLKEVINNIDIDTDIDTDNLPSDLKSKYQNINIEQLIDNLVNKDEATAQSQSGQSLNKQDLLSTSTDFNTFKYGIAIHKVAEIIAAYLKQQDNGKYLRLYMPAVYAAIAANFKADKADINLTTFKNIIKESAKLNGLGSLNSTEIENIAEAAREIYNFSTKQPKPGDDNPNNRRIPLAKAEILTQSAKKAVVKGDSNKAAKFTDTLTKQGVLENLIDNTDNTDSPALPFSNIDFETVTDEIVSLNDPTDEQKLKTKLQALKNGEYTLEDFVTNVIGDNRYIELRENNAEKITKAYFKETGKNDTQHKGKITLCTYDSSKDPDERAAIFTGNWAWDERKTYQLRAEALGVQVSIEHLNPNLHSGADECNGDSTTIKTCLRVNTPQFGEQAAKAQYFTSKDYYLLDATKHTKPNGLSSENDIDKLIEQVKENTDATIQIKKFSGNLPETVKQCFQNKEL